MKLSSLSTSVVLTGIISMKRSIKLREAANSINGINWSSFRPRISTVFNLI